MGRESVVRLDFYMHMHAYFSVEERRERRHGMALYRRNTDRQTDRCENEKLTILIKMPVMMCMI